MNLLPIIRRKRRPLIPVETVPVGPVKTESANPNANERSETKEPNSDDSVSQKTSTAADVVDY